MGDITAIGTTERGRTAYLHSTAAKWWLLWMVRLSLDYPDIHRRIVIIQALGEADASAGTHSDGWAVDISIWPLTTSQRAALIAHARSYGASGTWERTPAQGFEPHIHMALDSGGNPETACQYQCRAVRRGYNGLGNGGTRGRDTSPAPATWRTIHQGIRLLEESDMARFSQDQKNDFAAVLDHNIWGTYISGRGTYGQAIADMANTIENMRIWLAPVRRNGPVLLNQEIADAKTTALLNHAKIEQLQAEVAELKTGMDKILTLLEARG
uniref:Endolysin n=1 Tax=Dulem virus 32 TaxID=3145750 RepID=A0AAU8B0K0_9CAUD